MSSDKPNISVIIVTHNSWPELKNCLQSIQQGGTSHTLELIVIDNASQTDPTHEIRRVFPSAHVVRNESNEGFAVACNQGAGLAGGDLLLFLNPDSVLDSSTIDNLAGVAVTRASAGLVVPRLRNPDGSFQANCRQYPSVRNLLFSRQSALGRIIGRRSSEYTLPDFSEITAVPAVAATVMMVHRSVFEKVGGFDERFYMFVEDTDLSYRVSSAGFENLFVPGAGATHRWGRGGSASKMQRLYRHHMSLWKYFMKYRPDGFSVIVLPVLLLLNGLVMSLLPDRRPA